MTSPITVHRAINAALRKLKPHRKEFELFKKNLTELLSESNRDESEEHLKTLISDFLKNTYYSNKFAINTKDRNDLVIHNGKSTKTSVAVIMEIKRQTNITEMMRLDRLNTKALQELVLYYLRERITENNFELKQIIGTNLDEWFVFDAQEFEQLFARDKQLVEQFKQFENKQLSSTNTDFFYQEIASPKIEKVIPKIKFTHLKINDYSSSLKTPNQKQERKLIRLFRFFSPEHLLKLPFENDSNNLDKGFYSELLHIIGLAENKKKGKKIIERAKSGTRHSGSLLENAITQIDSMDKLSRLPNRLQYGEQENQQLFGVGLELCITWINRILFLKLLEAQLLSYHKRDKAYQFLSFDKIKNYDDLEKLFFRVLAKKQQDRTEEINKIFRNVPYLNSSLFEPVEIEHLTLSIGNLEDNLSLPILSNTVLKDTNGKKRQGALNAIEYLFEFLNAYDFSSEGSENIQEDNKTLINASVLGLIFEKINGYKDGSFFTPGYITMYMSKEVLRKAVVNKFNQKKGWSCKNFTDLHNHIDDYPEANQIINSLTVCDPAVGSGHFLVSSLNEIIAIKSELKLLCDRHGRRLKNYDVKVINDDLVVTDEDNELFSYNPNSEESQRIQETLFNEKQTIIENCLFGVDINPNSVKICRLRLWIELLKNAYYKNATELETLPNIDINIKCGNSLISRFALDADLKKALKQSKYDIISYRAAVSTYRNATDKSQKRAMRELIDEIKNNFQSEINKNSKDFRDLRKFQGQLVALTQQVDVFADSLAKQRDTNKKITELTQKSKKLEAKLEAIKNNAIYRNAFEWRFEFPEVLDNAGNYQGFDVVIGNPPYMRVQEIKKTQPDAKIYYEKTYQSAQGAYDLANLFFEKAVMLAHKHAHNAYIMPHKFLNSSSASVFRDYLTEGQYISKISHFGANMIFEDAITYTAIVQFNKTESNGFEFLRAPFKSNVEDFLNEQAKYRKVSYQEIQTAAELYGTNQWILFETQSESNAFQKIYNNSTKIEKLFDSIFVGLQTSRDALYILNKIDDDLFEVPLTGKTYKLETDLLKPFLMGKDIARFAKLSTHKYVFFPYHIHGQKAQIIPLNEIATKYPITHQYISDHEQEFKSRESEKFKDKEHWHAYIYPKNLTQFEQPKLTSMEICSKYPNVTINTDNYYHATTIYSWVKRNDTLESYEFFLAIANSQLLWWFLKNTGDTLQGDARRMKTNYLNTFPVPDDVSEETENHIVEQVKAIMQAKNQGKNTSKMEADLNSSVNELYGLNEHEIIAIEACQS
ncbi:DUF7149 domain-containing protein [Marinicella meishanensis]|uniref:type IIG restriction enzyme/methyltransferase n=1 Tax=Marinicella meishanensis TaxID=2873263 RepID=UPI001CBD06B4|nr:Eco57I restriction-modification methylase domain-containing protein [Marinicella sp. NBU2979]